MNGFAKSTLFVVATSLAVLSFCWATGKLAPTYENDSPTYLEFDFSQPLSQIRTVGYPSFLRTVGSPTRVPLAHWICLTAATCIFCGGMIVAGYRWQAACLSAVTLTLGRSILEWGSLIAADSLAMSFAIASTGCFLATTQTRAHRGWWISLAVLSFCTYQVRPAYLFMIPLWPVTSLLADWLLLRRDASWREPFSRASVYAALTLLPFIAFCTVRLIAVGHFGLVSFGGYNIVGVASQLMDEELAGEMPADLQPLAKGIVARRAQFPDYAAPESFEAMEQTFNIAVWQIAVPEATEISSDNPHEVNRLLSSLSREIIKRRPGRYARWLAWNANHARQEIFTVTMFDKGTLLLMMLLLVAITLRLWKGPTGAEVFDAEGQRNERLANAQLHLEFHLLPWIAVGFLIAKTALVILVEPANSRYMSAAACLLPAALAVWTWHFIESCRIFPSREA